MSDPLDNQRREIDQRMSELEPLIEEYRRLKDAIAALGHLDRTGARASMTGSSASRAQKPRRPHVRARTGDLAARVLSAVEENPGITVPKLACKLDAKSSEVYRILQELKRKGKLTSRRGWSVPDATDALPTRSPAGETADPDDETV